MVFFCRQLIGIIAERVFHKAQWQRGINSLMGNCRFQKVAVLLGQYWFGIVIAHLQLWSIAAIVKTISDAHTYKRVFRPHSQHLHGLQTIIFIVVEHACQQCDQGAVGWWLQLIGLHQITELQDLLGMEIIDADKMVIRNLLWTQWLRRHFAVKLIDDVFARTVAFDRGRGGDIAEVTVIGQTVELSWYRCAIVREEVVHWFVIVHAIGHQYRRGNLLLQGTDLCRVYYHGPLYIQVHDIEVCTLTHERVALVISDDIGIAAGQVNHLSIQRNAGRQHQETKSEAQ